MQKLQRDLRLDVSESSSLHYQEKKSVCERGHLNRLELKIFSLDSGVKMTPKRRALNLAVIFEG